MISYVPAKGVPRGLCMIVARSSSAETEPLMASLRSLGIASTFAPPPDVMEERQKLDAAVTCQLRLLALLRFADLQLPNLDIIILVELATLPHLLALLRGRAASAARVRQIILLNEDFPQDLAENVRLRLLG